MEGVAGEVAVARRGRMPEIRRSKFPVGLNLRQARPVIEALEQRLVLSVAPVLSTATAPADVPPVPAVQSATPAFTASPLPLGANLNQQTDRIQDHPFV